MKCPVDKSPMIVVENRKIELDYCLKCSGVWLDSGELELLLEVLKSEGAKIADADFITPVKAVVKQEKRRCPICGRKMDKVWMGEENKVLIDTCPLGHGLWFDSGELHRVLEGMVVPGTAQPADVISFMGEFLHADYKGGSDKESV